MMIFFQYHPKSRIYQVFFLFYASHVTRLHRSSVSQITFQSENKFQQLESRHGSEG